MTKRDKINQAIGRIMEMERALSGLNRVFQKADTMRESALDSLQDMQIKFRQAQQELKNLQDEIAKAKKSKVK